MKKVKETDCSDGGICYFSHSQYNQLQLVYAIVVLPNKIRAYDVREQNFCCRFFYVVKVDDTENTVLLIKMINKCMIGNKA